MKNKYFLPHLQRLFLLLFFSFLGFQAVAQLTVTPATGPVTTHADQLAQYLVGQGVVVSNAQLTGANNSIGFFNGANSNIGIDQGVLLTTGNINNAPGPNNSGGASAGNGTPGLPILNALGQGNTFDGAMLEFDVQVASDTLRFEYVFASEEYPEYVCSIFDVFGFFISGPGIVGNVPGFPNERNIALVPGTTTPVSIGTIRPAGSSCAASNVQYYVSNNAGLTVQYDGFSVVLTAEIWGLTPCSVYHLKLAVADVSDQILDTGVFIKQGSLTSQGIQFQATTTVGTSVYPNALEGCVNGGFGIKRVGDISQLQTVEFSVMGTATNGFDYVGSNNQPLDSVVVFLPGQDSAFIEIVPIADGLLETQETVVFILKSSCVNIVTGDSAILYIDDRIPLDVTTTPAVTGPICENQPIQINSHEPGFSGTGINYFWSPAIGLSDDLIPNPIATPPVGTTTYTVIASVSTCMVTGQVTLTVEPEPIEPAGPDFFSCQPGSGTLQGSGGGTYSWVGPNSFTSTSATPTFTFGNPGNYILTVTTPAGCVYTDTAVVSSNAPSATIANQQMCAGGQGVTLQPTVTAPGTLTYSYSPATGLSNPNIANPVATPATTTTYTLSVTDQNGCTGTTQVTVTVNALPQIDAGASFGICPGETAQLTATDANNLPGVTYSWTNGQTSLGTGLTLTATPTQATTYTLTAANGTCISTDQVNVSIKPLPQFTAGAPLSICAGDAVTLPASEQSGLAVTYTWTPASSLTQSNVLQPIASPTTTTTYTATATADGCSVTDMITVSVTPAPILTVSANTSICFGESATITASDATALPGTVYGWTDSTGASLGSSMSITQTPAVGSNVYYFTATPATGICAKTDSVEIVVKPLPQLTAGTDLAVCPQQTVELQATETTGANITWSPATGLSNPNVIAPIASPSTTTTYTATANLNGCVATDQVTVTASPAADIVAGANVILCPNVNGVTITATENTGAPGITTAWAPVNGSTVSTDLTTTVNPGTTTDYVINATLGQCTVRDTLTVLVVPDMNLNIMVSPEGGLAPLPVQFSASGNNLVSYMWDFAVEGNTADVSTEATPTYTYLTPGEYQPSLIATDNMGCVDTATYNFVRVSYGVPNIFTPNGDGTNDVFNVGILRQNTRLRILGRWGNIVYESNNYKNDWDASGVPDGVYFYDVNFPDSGESFKGWVEILR